MQHSQLIDAPTHLHIQGILSTDPSPSPSICPKDVNNPYLSLLSKFPALTQVCSPDTPVKHDITHHIETTGPPVSARPRRLAHDRLRAAKQEFEHMLQLGIIRPSSSAWSQSQRQLHQFIGLVNFYHRFPPHCADLMQPSMLSSPLPTQSLRHSPGMIPPPSRPQRKP